jgi:two-component system sensor histidine kinase YesM
MEGARLGRWFQDLRIQYKLLFTFAPLLIAGLLFVALIVYYNVEQTLISNICEANVSKLKQISGKIEILNRNIISVTNVYYLNGEIRNFLKSETTDDEYIQSRQLSDVADTVQNIRNIFDYLKFSTTLVGFNNRFFTNGELGREDTSRLRTQKWMQDIMEKPNEIYWTTTYEYGNKYIYSAVRYLLDIYTGKPLGFLVIDFDEDILSNTYENVKGENHFIIDSKGTVVSNKNKQILSVNFSNESFFKQMNPYNSGYFQTSFSKTQVLVSFYKVPNLDWYIVDMVPQDEVLEGVYGTKKFIYLITFVMLVITLMLTYMLSNLISSPLKKLAVSMNSIQSGNMNALMDLQQKDEVGLLALRFNSMVNRINELIVELVNEHEERRKYEFQSLQAQINPHFLFNTLTSIRWMSKSNKPEIVNKMIISLVRLLKQTISSRDEYITFGDELAFLHHYVYIQKIRYSDKFHVNFNFSPEILPYKMLKLIIQPLIENAIFHGIEPKEGPGEIWVNAYQQDKLVILEIIDDGVGIPLEKQALTDAVETKESGIALLNIQQRLKLNFGQQYDLILHSAPGKGTKVILTLPILKGEESGGNSNENSYN